jgi:ABC-type cobalamin/Fe3+-siderophores transport system ATPase subunit
MRLLRVYIDGYRNLKNVTVDFDKDSLTTVVIGENGSGKSNLIEAIVEVIKWIETPKGQRQTLGFKFVMEYKIRKHHIKASNSTSNKLHVVYNHVHKWDAVGSKLQDRDLFPSLIFGYYSGSGRKLEKLFDAHQSRYYGVINKERPDEEYEVARKARRLFYCRPIHGVLALLSYLAKPGTDKEATALLTEKLGITGFHSALAHFKEPSWFPGSKASALRETGNVWGAHGPAGKCARALKVAAFHPLELEGAVVDDYRRKASNEAQLACFLRDEKALKAFAANYDTDQDMFAALEAADISDLFRDMIVWVTRTNDASGDISFSDLSDGERQLLMVLGLIRVSRGKEALFLLDEPDTHLNPAWQLTYLDLIREWTEVAADEDKCQIIMTSHNPLTIAALTKKEVRVMQKGADDQMTVSEPYADPRGMGFTSTLTEIFGLPTTLDPKTQKQIDERNRLSRLEERSDKQERDLIALNDKLDRLGFLHESRDPLYDDFLKAVQDVKYADRPVMTQDQIEKRRLTMQALIKSLSTEQGTAH